MNICIIGRTGLLYKITEHLHKNGFIIKLIITSKAAEHETTKSSNFRKLAQKIRAEFLETQNINKTEIRERIKKSGSELGVSVNNPLLINKETISLYKYGILNAHSGDLPKYKGNASPNWAILKGEKKIGLTIHFMDERLDSGDIVMKNFFKLTDNTTIGDYYRYAEKVYPKMFLRAIQKINNGRVKLKKQPKDPKKTLRTYARNKQDGKINWNNSAVQIDKLVRASGDPFYGAFTYFNSKKLFILKSKIERPKFRFLAVPGQVVERRKNGQVLVACEDAFLVLIQVKYQKKIYDNPSELIRTIHTRLGMDVEAEIEKILKLFQKKI